MQKDRRREIQRLDSELPITVTVEDLKTVIARTKLPPFLNDLEEGIEAIAALDTKGRTALVPALDKLRDDLLTKVRERFDAMQRLIGEKPRS